MRGLSGRAALMNRKARRASLKDPNHARSPTLRIADLLAQARWYHQQGQSGRAQDICNLILKREPRHVHALNLLGLILQRAGHHRHAARIFAAVVQYCDAFTDKPDIAGLRLMQVLF